MSAIMCSVPRGGMIIGLLGILLATGFSSQPLPQTPLPAPLGLVFYQKGLEIWTDACQKDLRGDAWAAQLDKVVSLLEHSAEVDAGNALYLTKKSELLLSTGNGSVSRADLLLDQSSAITRFWPPYWLGKCEVCLQQNRLAQAEQALAGADIALAELENKSADTSASQSSKSSREIWGAWLMLSERMSTDGSTLSAGDISSADQAIARCRGRAALYRFKIAGMRGAGNPQLLALLQTSLQCDSGYVPARIALAAFMHAEGNYQAAEAQLVTYMTPSTPLVANNGAIQVQLADIYKDWYVHGGHGHLQFADARKLYDLAIIRHPDDLSALLGLAELLASRTGADAVDHPRDADFHKGVSYLTTPAILLDQALRNGADQPGAPASLRASVARVRGLIARKTT